MDEFQCVVRRIREVIAGSTVPEDPDHSQNTLRWLLELDPKADPALRISALGHDINLPRYFEREGWEETRRRCAWGYLRLSKRARSIVAGLELGDPLGQLMNESIEAARVLQKSGEPS